MELKARILELKRKVAGVSVNPILDAFDITDCELIDDFAQKDSFVQSRKEKCIKLLENVDVDFVSSYKSAFEEYNEAAIYLGLKSLVSIENFPEENRKTPDFKVYSKNKSLVFIELKTLSFADGNLNYKDAQEQSLNAKIDIERQLKKGKKVAFGVSIISPLNRSGRHIDQYSTTYIIETIIDKINQNIKKEQFELGPTILMVDLKQIILPSQIEESALALFFQPFLNSIVSGVLWNVFFGKVNHQIYKPAEFEGRPNIDRDLSKNGILIEYQFIRGVIISGYKNYNKRQFVGFYRHNEANEDVVQTIESICDFTNDDMNQNAWRVLEAD